MKRSTEKIEGEDMEEEIAAGCTDALKDIL
jgi:hypothetical protein